MSKVLVVIADGSEEIEAVTVIDVLRRVGADVRVASVTAQRQVTASRGVVLVADCRIASCTGEQWDLIVVPGGLPGAEAMHGCPQLIQMLADQLCSERLLAAICAAPAVVLGRHGLIQDYSATCHPAFFNELGTQASSVVDRPVVLDRNLVTSQAPGTAMVFALKLVELLFGEEKARQVAAPMVV